MTNVAYILVTDPQKSLEDHVGIPLLKRTVLSAQKGGIEKFIIVAKESNEQLKVLLSGDKRIHSLINWSDDDGPSDLLRDKPSKSVLIIRAEAVFDSDLIKKMGRLELNDASAYVAVRRDRWEAGNEQCVLKLNGDYVVACGNEVSFQADKNHRVNNPDDTVNVQIAGLMLARPDTLRGIIVEGANSHINLSNIMEGLLNRGKVKAVDVTDELCMEITSQETMRESKKKLCELLGLATDSPFSIHVNRKLSRLVSGVLVELPITPNQITLMSFLAGLVACWFFLQGGYRYSVLGAMVLYASVILDLSDGEVARLKFMYSKHGALLDTISDSIVYSGVVFCMALAIHRDAHIPNIITVGAVAAVAMFICSNLDFYLHFMEKDLGKDQPSPIMRLFANEDYFYLSVLGFTVFDRLQWYIWVAAAGTLVYTFVLIGKLMIIRFSGGKV